jgi:hypothetical protein
MTPEGPTAGDIPAAEIIYSLEQKGYACSDLGEEVGDGYVLQRCETGDARPGGTGVMVLIWSTPGGNLHRVQANSYGHDEDPDGVFAYLTAMPSTSDEETDEAQAWVERNFATADVNPVQRSAGGMNFTLEGGGQTRILNVDVPRT